MAKITEKIYRNFYNQRIVRWKEVFTFLGNDKVKTTNSIRLLIKSGKIIKIKKGLYFFKRPNEWYEENVEINPLLLAANLHPKATVGYHAALQCYGVANSVSYNFQIALDRSVARVFKPFEYNQCFYKFYRTDLHFGIDSSIIDDVRISHFSRERILLEGLMHPDRFLGMAEFLQSIEGFTWINIEDLLKLRKNYPQKTINMRLGWLLSRFRKQWHIPESVFSELEKERPAVPLFLVKKTTVGNKLDTHWNLMVPKSFGHLEGV